MNTAFSSRKESEPSNAASHARPKLLFVVTEDWFLRSHFMPLLKRARDDGWRVTIVARDSGVFSATDLGDDAAFVPAPFARGSMNPWDIMRERNFIRGVFEREQPDVVHAIALRPILLTALADWGRAPTGRVFAVVGRGFIGAHRTLATRIVDEGLSRVLRRALRAPHAVLAVENAQDREWAERGESLPGECVACMPGAGVCAEYFQSAPEPEDGPINVGVVGRLVRSKGVDVAVEAISRLRAEGLDINLHVAGKSDRENPQGARVDEIVRWRRTPGVRMRGRIADINRFWAGMHIACAPSRGGEGLPRSVLEAAACGRPVVATDTPGCRDFVEDGVNGRLIPPGDAAALAAALRGLAVDKSTRQRFGAAARATVMEGYTERHAADVAAAAWGVAIQSADASS